ncbi:recombinase family protein [Catenulispora rubra]|uniref:recombinase family protein n=1 Tax=Catenulispora rubra TaxID=280293 RepID=UPI00189220E7|nr:recombinase family protein [Catenulispora rubra]
MRTSEFEGESAAIYCRISHIKDDDQTGVERQERICREMAERMGMRVSPDHVFIDPSRSAWQRKRKRPGWDSLLEAMDAGAFRHVLAYHPDRLMRQPPDLEQLLIKAEERNVILHGQANRRDLSSADDRFFLRIEVAHACKSSDDTSRRVMSAQEDALAAGKAHGGRRAYGYTKDMSAVVPDEAEVVKEIFTRFLDGDAIWTIFRDIHERGIPSAGGGGWTVGRVRALLTSARHAGLIMYRGEVQKDEQGNYRKGAWPEIVTVGEWEEASRLRARRSLDYADARRSYRHYLLSGMVLCTKCTRSMVGNMQGGVAYYKCTRSTSSEPDVCSRKIRAKDLEEFVVDAAKDFLENLSASALTRSPVTASTEDDAKAEAEDKRKLAEVREMWDANEIGTDEMRQMQAKIKKRMAARQRATVVRPLTALEGVVIGPGAGKAFDKMTGERKVAVLRFLFPAVRIEASSVRGVVDFGRVKIDPPQL